jgi:hypothetical protein
MRASRILRRRGCRHCSARAADPPLLISDPRQACEWFLCEACWLLLEIGFSDARPYDDLYAYLSPIEGRLSDAEIAHHILRGQVLLERRGGLLRTWQPQRYVEDLPGHGRRPWSWPNDTRDAPQGKDP